jgi:hypothetical protein
MVWCDLAMDLGWGTSSVGVGCVCVSLGLVGLPVDWGGN